MLGRAFDLTPTNFFRKEALAVVPIGELIKRRDALLSALETLKDERTWQLTFDAYLTVCEVLEEQEVDRRRRSQLVLSGRGH